MSDRDPEETRGRDQVVLSRLAKIQYKVDSLEQSTAFALRADREKHQGEVEKIFNKSTERARVYLAANGSRNVQAIADHLDMRQQNVSVALRELGDEGLLEMVEGARNNTIWMKTAIGRTLRIPQFLVKTYNLDSEGRRQKGGRKPKPKTRSRRA